ncbi:MAG TPA: hypothetical protein DCS29_00470 [Candidatus Magasanikbacteria bacterium]|nr:MAG: hypothetical protein A2479_01150 [Candidatus Magasanikbacteria bacterium RIFOXYC2_FULL_39_8]HAT03239.1 hypothetical protein [Candidatus Magasanikbacteria bacterium]
MGEIPRVMPQPDLKPGVDPEELERAMDEADEADEAVARIQEQRTAERVGDVEEDGDDDTNVIEFERKTGTNG